MKQTIIFAALFTALLPQQLHAQTVKLTVNNPTQQQRQEVVEADLHTVCQLLGVDDSTALIVKNAAGREQTYQRSYDGKLLFDVSVQPGSQATYTVVKGQPAAFRSCVGGRVYPERLDDLAWENDRGIYRIYGPALQRRGERSFGTDVWVKNTPEPVVEHRYRLHAWGWAKSDSLKKAGRKQEGNELWQNTSFHVDHGYGMDVYAVGPTLGCGAPALMRDGHLVFPYCYKHCDIVDNGPLRFTVLLTYGTTADGITEHRRITLDKGSHFNRMTVWYDGLQEPVTLATGVVLHGVSAPVVDSCYVLYADPTDNPSVHQSQIFVGTLFPQAVDETTEQEGNPAHALGLVHQYHGQPYTYYFGSAWSNYDVPTMTHWRLLAEERLSALSQPLTVAITSQN